MNLKIRMIWCALFALLLLALVILIRPEQGPVVIHKLSMVLLGAFAGYWADRWAFPYSRPDMFLVRPGEVKVNHKRVFAAAQVRRAVVMGGAMLSVGLGL